MTGIIVQEKTQGDVDPATKGEIPPEKRRRGTRCTTLVATAVLSALVTAVLVTVAMGLIYYFYFASYRQNKGSNDQKEWISWTRVKDGILIHESALLDCDAQTGLMVSAESYKIGEDNSIALHDFEKVTGDLTLGYSLCSDRWRTDGDGIEIAPVKQEGYIPGFVAIRDFQTNTCYVTNINVPDFETVKKMIEDRQGKVLPIQQLKQARVRPDKMTADELGPKLTSFCDGAESHWFEKLDKHEKRRKRRTDKLSHTLSCYYYRFEESGLEQL